MPTDRYVLLALASGDAWAADLATALGAIEVVVCASVEEVRVRLRSGRPFSGLVVDDRRSPTDGLDDLVGWVEQQGLPVVRARVGPGGRLPASAVDLVRRACRPIPFATRVPPVLLRRPDLAAAELAEETGDGGRGPGRLVAVCGAGSAAVAFELATALAGRSAGGHDLVLADLARPSAQAFLHGEADAAPALDEFVHTSGRSSLGAAAVRAMTRPFPRGGYRWLPGLASPAHWTAVRPWGFDLALASLRRAFGMVVAEVTADFEGEADGGSLDVEERNHPARRVAGDADIVIVSRDDGELGGYLSGQTLAQIEALGVPGARVRAWSRTGDPSSLAALVAPFLAGSAPCGRGRRPALVPIAAGTLGTPDPWSGQVAS